MATNFTTLRNSRKSLLAKLADEVKKNSPLYLKRLEPKLL